MAMTPHTKTAPVGDATPARGLIAVRCDLMFTVQVPPFTLDTDAPIVARIAVIVEGLNADGTDWGATIFAPGMSPSSAHDLFTQGCQVARQMTIEAG